MLLMERIDHRPTVLQDLPVKAICEPGRIPRISEAENNAIYLVDLSETSNAQFFAALHTELDHRVQVVAKATFGHTQADIMTIPPGWLRPALR